MAKRPSPRAVRKALDDTDVRETVVESRRVEPTPRKTRKRPDPLPSGMFEPLLGRPGVYSEHYPELARRLALLGVTDKEMASVFGISVEGLYVWDKKYPDFMKSRARGGMVADGAVAARLFHRAVGYDHEAVKIFMPQGAEEPIYAPYTEHYPPDTQAATWWLKNRQKDKWQDKTDINWNGRLAVAAVPIDMAQLTEEQREVMRDVLLLTPPTIEGEAE